MFICLKKSSLVSNMNNKNLKPDLLNPIFRQRIVNTIKPQHEDYWKPLKDIYDNYIWPNIYLVLIIILIIIMLIYRYKITQDNRNTQDIIPNETTKYTDLALLLYNQQKENAREPKNNMAYPTYPYNGSSGSFISSKPNINEQ